VYCASPQDTIRTSRIFEFFEDLRTSKKVLLKEYLTEDNRRKKYEREDSLKKEDKRVRDDVFWRALKPLIYRCE